MNEINKLLAHQPWKLNGSHIEKLARGRYGHHWSVSEILQAIVILTHFHGLTSFVFASGINNCLDGNTSLSSSTPSSELSKVEAKEQMGESLNSEKIMKNEPSTNQPHPTSLSLPGLIGSSSSSVDGSNSLPGVMKGDEKITIGGEGNDGGGGGERKENVTSPSCQMIKKAFVDDSPPPEPAIGSPLNEGSVEVRFLSSIFTSLSFFAFKRY